jgi:hypothetical protein
VWDAWVPAGCASARACIEALLQGPEKKVEIQVEGCPGSVERDRGQFARRLCVADSADCVEPLKIRHSNRAPSLC